MLSGVDLLEQGKKSGVELLEQGGEQARVPTSGVELLQQLDTPTTTAPVEIESVKTLPAKTSPNILFQQHKDRMADWYERSSGTKNFGIGMYNKEKEDLNIWEKSMGVVGETLQGLSDLATHPLETLRGGAEVLMNVPGFSIGLLDAAGMAAGEIVNQLSKGPGVDLESIYFAAAEGMQRSMEILEPDLSPIFGERTPTSDLASQVVMAPMAALSMAGQTVAEWEGFKDYPNVRGAARFAGDITGLITMGALLHTPSRRAEFTKDVEDVVKTSERIVEKERLVEANPNEMVKQVQKKMLEMEKIQAELKAKEIMDGLSKDALIREELARQAETVAREKMLPVQGRAEQIFTSKKGNRYRKIDDQWVDENGQVVTNNFKLKAIEKGVEKKGKVTEVKPAETVKKFKPLEETKEEIKTEIDPMPKPEVEPIKEVDRAIGVDVPAFEGTKSPFFQDLAKTREFADIYLERRKSLNENVELFTQKLINDVNQWYHEMGDIPIDQVRDGLSNLATRADDLRSEFITGQDHFAWKEIVQEAAIWARRLDRVAEKGEVKELSKTERIDLIKQAWANVQERKAEGKTKELTPRDKLDRYSAIADMANTPGGATAVPTILRHRDKFSKGELDKLTEYFTTVGSNRQKVETVAKELGIGDLIDFNKKDITVGEKPKTILRKKGEGGGTQLYDIGGATAKGAKDVAKQIAKLYKSAKAKGREARGVKDFRPKDAIRAVKEELSRDWIDRSGNIRRMMLKELGDEGYKALQGLYTAKGAGALAYSKLKQMEREVYGGLPRSVKGIVDDLIFHSRIVDIAKYKTPKQFKELEKYTPEEAIVYLEMFGEMEGLDPKFARELYHVREDGSVGGRVGAYFDHMRQVLKDMLEAELITQEEFDNLSAHNYRRLKVVEVFDKKRPSMAKKGTSVYDSGVESLAKGREATIFERDARIMAMEVFNRAYGRILNNRANKNLLEIARDHKDNPFVRIKEGKEDKIPSGWHRHFLYEKGERKQVYLSPEMSKEWISVNPETSFKYSQLMRYASLSPVLRTFATGVNWGFAMANLPRDVMHTWFAARMFKDGEWQSVYSPHAPVFGMQIAADQIGVFSDALLRKGRYKDYIDQGGGMEFLTHQGRIWQKGKHLEGPVDYIYNFMGYFGETTEIMTRLAVRDRVIKRRAKERGLTLEEARKDKDIVNEATFVARDYMDFAQGGGLSKAMDNALPYLNAAIQGTRGLVRSFEPGSGTAMSSTYKLSQFAALVTGSYIAYKALAPKTMKELEGNIATTNNFVVPLGDWSEFEDSRGQTRYMFFKVPIDPGQKFFKTFFEASADKWLGNEVDVGRVVSALKEQSPVGVSNLPPSVSGVLGYVANKDFWRMEDIWKQEGPFGYTLPEWAGGDPMTGSKQEYIPGRTPQAMIDIGKYTGLSPERTKHAIEEVVTSGSMYSYLAGQMYDAMFDEMPKGMREKHLAEVLSQTPIVSRFFGITNPYGKHAEKIDKAQEEYEVKRFTENRKLDMLAEGYLFQDNVSRKEVFDYIEGAKDRETADRLRERFRFQEATKDLPERSFWMRLQSVAVEVRAEVFVDRLRNATPEQQSQIWREYDIMSRAKGIISPRFRREVSKLMGEEED